MIEIRACRMREGEKDKNREKFRRGRLQNVIANYSRHLTLRSSSLRKHLRLPARLARRRATASKLFRRSCQRKRLINEIDGNETAISRTSRVSWKRFILSQVYS